MMMSILLVLVQFPGCWAANCSSRPWVGKTATMKYNSELFSLGDIMSWWCLFKFYIQLHILFWHSYPPTKSCMWHRVKVQVNVVNIMRPQVRVGLGRTLDAFACQENQTPSKWYFLNAIVLVKSHWAVKSECISENIINICFEWEIGVLDSFDRSHKAAMQKHRHGILQLLNNNWFYHFLSAFRNILII